MKSLNKYISIAGISLAGINTSLFGAGYQVVEQGAANMGTAFAGATVNSNNDASAAFWNPSTIAFMPLKDGETLVNIGGFIVDPSLAFSDNGSTVPAGPNYDGQCAVTSKVPNFYVVHKFNENWGASLSCTAPWGLESDYQENWVGRDQALRSFLMTVDINPSVSYKVNEWFSISGGVSAQYSYCTLTNWFPLTNSRLKLHGDSWSVGGNIGFTVKYAEDGRIGFQWRSAIDHTLSGEATLGSTNIADITADMHMPDTFTIGIYQRLRGDFDMFAVMAEYSYITWSVFDNLTIKGLSLGGRTITEVENWVDTSRVSAGIHMYPTEDITLRFGICYDECPVPSPQDRTSRIPCADRLWLACGLGYKYENWTFDISYTYIFVLDNSAIDRRGLVSNLQGSYSAHINVFGVQLGYKF